MQHFTKQALASSALILKGEEDDPENIVTKAIEDLSKTVDERLKKVEEKGVDPKVEERLKALETKANRPGGDKKTEEPTEERKAFSIYLARGDALPAEERKALTVSSDPSGGYFAPAEMSSEFIKDLVEFSPVRSVASVRSTGAPSVVYPKRTGITNAKWGGETEAQEESTASFGQAEIPVHELKTYVDISNQLLADSAGQAETEVRLALSEDFGQKEGSAFVNGTGAKQPEGFMTNPDIASFANGHATNLSADALIKLMYSLPATYRGRGSWAMNGTTLGVIRTLKDGNGNYLWQPSYQAGQPETILGRPVVEMVDMEDIAANAFPLIYGDFSAYRILDRVSLSILVNPYLLATSGLTRIHATRRVGGRVLQAARFKKLKMATS
ncbi:phage major capsid protein [Martelella radicis]|uniref:HK97 family phage major capsid protein n=1 Tax=Martelella radicis TaxID=1397476 RepID=A0A7W6KNY7_9HYPH|nr:phage major capsid protein [Martelella radicis]MBB4123293.1 HK97 family phage major capsid protein [Martelella radicis]